MAANMDLQLFASKNAAAWWWNDSMENHVFPNATNRELFELSKADFPVEIVPIFKKDGSEIPGYFILENTRTGAALRMAKSRFQALQSETLFEKLDQLGNITDIGAIGQGEKVFFSLDAGQFEIGEGNTHKQFINAVLPHDGTMKITLGLGDFRIECQNTFNLWKRSLDSTEILACKQTANAEAKIDGWVKAFQEMQAENETLKEKFKRLASMKFSAESQAGIIGKLFGGDKDKPSTRSINTQKMLAEIIADNASNVSQDVRGTGYDLFNGLTYWTSRGMGLKANTSALESVMFGSGQKLAETALNLILESIPDGIIPNRENLVRTITV